MRDAAGLVAPLSWLAVWNRQLIARKNGREEAEDDDNDEDAYDPLARAGVLYATICRNGPSMHDADAASSGTSQEDARSQRDLLARRIGLAQGLVDFTRSFASRPSRQNDTAEDSHIFSDKPDPTKEVRVLQSQNQRLVFLQPEPEYWIVAAFDRYLPQPTNSNEIEEKKNSTHKKSQHLQPRLHPSSFLPNTALEDLLRRAYAEFRLLNGTFSNILQIEGQDTLRDKVSTFFERWRNEPKLIPLGIPRAPPSLVRHFLQPPSGYSIVAVSHSGILETPTKFSTTSEEQKQKGCSDPLISSDRLALACHLATFLSIPKARSGQGMMTSTATTTKSNIQKGKDRKIKKQSSFSTSTWKSLQHLGGITNYLPSIPNIPGTSSVSSSTTAPLNSTQKAQKKPMTTVNANHATSTSNETGESTVKSDSRRTVSGSAWIPTFGLFSTNASSNSDTGKTRARDSVSQETSTNTHPDSSLHGGVAEVAQAPTAVVDDRKPGTQENPLDDAEVDLPNSATTDISAQAISEAILDTIPPQATSTEHPELDSARSQEILSHTDSEGSLPEASLQSKFKAKWHQIPSIHVGKECTATPCQVLSNDDVAMALVPITTQEQADSNTLQIKEQDKIVIDQYFTHLATLEAYPPPSAILVNSTSRTFLSFGTTSCSDVVEQTIDDRASASNSSLRQRYNLAINAKTDTNKLIKSNTCELFVRTHFSQWLVAERNKTTEPSITKLTILPKSVGKEGSLLDADAEMRRISSEQ